MKESVLHYVWQHKLFPTQGLITTDGERIEVIDVGRSNTDAGPDFFNAKIKINDTVWVGNVEIHTFSSDWKKHNHQYDKAYDSVILHVVTCADAKVIRTNGEEIRQIELAVPEHILNNYDLLLNAEKWIPCGDKICNVPSIFIQSWKNALLTERLEQKTGAIKQLLVENNNHWEEAFYVILARNFGFGTNSQAFELLAKSIPLNILAKHKDNLFQLEALFFGQAGLLPDNATDDYTAELIREFKFLKGKYNLQPKVTASQWKLLRLRPVNFPHIRIAQFAALIHNSSKLFSKVTENPSIEYLQKLFDCEPSEYWKNHYTFSVEAHKSKSKKLGLQSVNVILINTVIPVLFCYATEKGNQDLKDKAISLLEKIPAEKNAIITNWKNLGLESNSAYDTQALLQLKKLYCDEKKCLRCRIGHKVLTMPKTIL